jgi:hypothetical protein
VTTPVTKKVNQPEAASSEILVAIEGTYIKTLYTSSSLNNLDFSSNSLENGLQKAVDADKQLFQLMIGFADVSANNIKDYYHIHVFNVVLHVKYEIPG